MHPASMLPRLIREAVAVDEDPIVLPLDGRLNHDLVEVDQLLAGRFRRDSFHGDGGAFLSPTEVGQPPRRPAALTN